MGTAIAVTTTVFNVVPSAIPVDAELQIVHADRPAESSNDERSPGAEASGDRW